MFSGSPFTPSPGAHGRGHARPHQPSPSSSQLPRRLPSRGGAVMEEELGCRGRGLAAAGRLTWLPASGEAFRPFLSTSVHTALREALL